MAPVSCQYYGENFKVRTIDSYSVLCYYLDMTPKQIVAFEKEMNFEMNRARANPGKLIRVTPGWYFVEIEGKIYEIEQLDFEEPHPDNGWWVARAKFGSWYSDPYPTLRELKQACLT